MGGGYPQEVRSRLWQASDSPVVLHYYLFRWFRKVSGSETMRQTSSVRS